ncbi:MAG: hypothetical protein RLZZ618_3577 [Pseudomonadota bacterium]|jgi:transglutaminase-like putative cysteine protease
MALSLPSRLARGAHWPGWRHLPREARDTLFLLGVIAWTLLPHVQRLPVWATAFTTVVLLWRARLAVRGGALPNRWWMAAGLALAIALTLLTYKTVLGQQPGVTMAALLMGLKTLELRAKRDAFVVFFLGFFIVLTHFLNSQSMLVAASMLVSVWGLLTALVLAHMPVGQPSLKLAARLALRTALFGAPLMVLLFVLFPRIGPLWGVPQDGAASTGLSNSMRLGSVAEIAQDDTIAMRVKFLDRVPEPDTLYFRGPVLSRFDGIEWRPATTEFPIVLRPRELSVKGPALRYEVTLEPSRLPLLPLLDTTVSVSPLEGLIARQRDALDWATNRVITERLRFEATAHTEFTFGPLVHNSSLDAALFLPAGTNPATRAWALALKQRLGDASTSQQLAQAVFEHLRTGGYSYTLAPGLYGELDPRQAIDEFWLGRKEGFCEHFAASFVVVMRAMGVPARVVTGFQGTDPLPVDGYYLVRRSYAHAWAEYWQAGKGWLRADPTAWVAPERVARGRNLVRPPEGVAGAINTLSPALAAQLKALWETLDNRWNQWVLNYARGQQIDLLKNIGFESPSWEDLALLLTLTLSSLSLMAAVWAWWDRRRQDPWARQAQAMRKALQRLGLQADAHDTPRRLAERVQERFGARGDSLVALLKSLEMQRYGPSPAERPSSAWLRSLRGEVRLLRPLNAQMA